MGELGDAMEDRRVHLGYRWAEVSKRSGINIETLRSVRKADRPVRPLTASGIERALKWPAGTVGRILSGEPAPAGSASPNSHADKPRITSDSWGVRVDESELTDEELDLWEEVHLARLARVRAERERRAAD